MQPNGSTGLGARIRLAERRPEIQERLKDVLLRSAKDVGKEFSLFIFLHEARIHEKGGHRTRRNVQPQKSAHRDCHQNGMEKCKDRKCIVGLNGRHPD